MSWRVALVDSCGRHAKALASAAFVSDGNSVRRRESDVDASGHGTRIAGILTWGEVSVQLFLAQVFIGRAPASAAAVAAAVDWAVAQGANLVHLSLGLTAERVVLREAIARAVSQGLIVVAASPARGEPVFPAAYPQVIAATGDARCLAGELSHLGPRLFGGSPRAIAEPSAEARSTGGASLGAAWVSRAVLDFPSENSADRCVASLAARARFHGPERRAPAVAPARQEVHTVGP